MLVYAIVDASQAYTLWQCPGCFVLYPLWMRRRSPWSLAPDGSKSPLATLGWVVLYNPRGPVRPWAEPLGAPLWRWDRV